MIQEYGGDEKRVGENFEGGIRSYFQRIFLETLNRSTVSTYCSVKLLMGATAHQ
jgi:hypothetical protein